MKERTYQIVLEGIVITVTKKRIKNMYLRIKKEDGMVLISAPYQINVFHVWRIEAGATEYIRQIFFFCDRSDKGKSAKQVIALHDGKVFDIYFATVVVWLGGDIAACCKIVTLICLVEAVHIDKIHMGDRRIADIGECQAFSIWHFIA